MARRFINMFLDETDNYGYYKVEYIDHDGSTRVDIFETDLEADKFYKVLMSER